MLHPARQLLAELMDGTVKNERNWHYEMRRPLPFPSRDKALHGSVHSDCSFGCIILCKLAGCPDPSGYNFAGYGNSQSFFNKLQHIPIHEAKIGDLIVYGYGGANHAVMVRGGLGANPLVWSHGQEKGPIFVRHSVEDAFHSGPSQALRIKLPVPPPTEAEARTVALGL
jgi:hypothetical protein